MSKVAAIFENPTCCNECPCVTHGLEFTWCSIFFEDHDGVILNPFHTKPDWCPLKEVKDGDEC